MTAALIEKLKAATGPDRELDRAIFQIVADGKFWPEHSRYWRAASMSSREPLEFTASMDAAVLLIPDGMFWVLGMGRTRPDEPLAGCSIVLPTDQINPVGQAEGDHLAICICIAALDARLAIDAVKQGGAR